jgi:hypothetical protein
MDIDYLSFVTTRLLAQREDDSASPRVADGLIRLDPDIG